MLLPATTVLPLIFLTFSLTILSSNCQQSPGDSCTINGGPGTCAVLPECEIVYNELLAGNPPSQICGFSGFDPVVCCPVIGVTKPTTTTTTRRPTTVRTTTTTRQPIPTGPLINVGNRGGVAAEKCDEYAKAVYQLVYPPTLTGGPKAPINMSVCAIRTRKLIVGGTKADPKEFPHMTAVGYNSGNRKIWGCGGTLVSERFVLSAAHCSYSADWGRAAWARVGDLNLARSDDGATPIDIRIIERINHPRYKLPSEYHDIALFKLQTPVTFNAWRRPACLPYTSPDIGTSNMAIATGWGRVDWADDEGSDDLLKVVISIVPQSRCNASFVDGPLDEKLNLGIVGEWQVCAGELGKDTCQGDSGGPLTITDDDRCMYTVVGVTSLGKLCGSIIPGVYTRVSYYIPWIERTIWPENF